MSFPTTKHVRPCILTPNPTHQTITKPTHVTMKPQSPTTLNHLHLRSWSLLAPPTAEEPPPPPLSMKLSERWMDYQGLNDWDGLLDPLDDTLRREIIRYGHFIEAAYRACNFDPSSASYAACRFPKSKLLRKSGFPVTGYRVTKNLTATSGIRLPRWAEMGPTWLAMQTGWIGYVAVCKDKKEISRLGRRDVVIALRGTATGLEWMENLRATLTPLPEFDSRNPTQFCCEFDFESDSEPMVESGFLSLYTSSFNNRPSLQNLVREEISRILNKYGGEPLSFTITGHSLGAALATLAAYDIKKTFKNSPLVTVVSFAGPRVGNWSFRCHLENQGTKILRIVNSDDVVTKVPGFVIDANESHRCVGGYTVAAAAANLTSWVQKLAEETQWVYADVGCELRLSSRDAPGLNGFNIAACHELKTYLHLVNGFVSSNCPFRVTARKMMTKLVKN